jgi:hypothetical protein
LVYDRQRNLIDDLDGRHDQNLGLGAEILPHRRLFISVDGFTDERSLCSTRHGAAVGSSTVPARRWPATDDMTNAPPNTLRRWHSTRGQYRSDPDD